MNKFLRWQFIALFIGVIGALNMCSTNSTQMPEISKRSQIEALVESGEYSKAISALNELLNTNDLSAATRESYSFEIQRLERIRKDFVATQADVLTFIKRYYSEVSAADIQTWENNKALEFKIIDGQKLYFEWAARNLFRIDPEMKKVWKQQHPDEEIKSGSGAKMDLDAHNQQIIQAAQSSKSTYVEPKRIRIKQSVTVKPDEVPAGELIKCWIPYPRLIDGRQEDIKLIHSMPQKHILAPGDALQRTIYMETPAIAGQAITFTVEYELSTHGVFHDIDADSVTQLKSHPELEQYLIEDAPHIVFTPEMVELSQRIIGDEQNPYRKAQLLFEWVDDNTPWASAREYSTIKCIPQYALENGHGDCGIQTLFFMTLCRMNGIPTRWQSGWELQPPHDSMHDWGLIYFEPYGWVPMDVTYGMRTSDDPKLHWFYLGGMDSYRIIFNDDYGQAFVPQKTHFRSETVDSQRGEVEWSGGNLYFDQWSWNFDWEVLE